MIQANDSLTFAPDVVYVKAGTKVTWMFTVLVLPHNVTFIDGPAFAHDLTVATPSASRFFSTPGKFRYVCTLHEGMEGEVIVKA